MKNYIWVIIVCCLMILISCSSPRGSRTKSNSRTIKTSERMKPAEASARNRSVKKDEVKGNYDYFRFADTTIIELLPEEVKASSAIIRQYSKCVDLFNEEKYDESCSQMQTFAETFADGDPLKYDAMFYWGECLIYHNKISQAEEHFLKMMNDPLISKRAIEKVLVRLGQVYCFQEEKQKAKVYFNKLKKEYPNSIYLPLANCDVIK